MTPEQIKAFFFESEIQTWFKLNQKYSLKNTRFFKEYMYRRYFPDLEERKKWTGYERFGHEYLALQSKLSVDRIKNDICLIDLYHLGTQIGLAI